MTKQIIIQYSILACVFIFYLVFTIRYSVDLSKNKFFNSRIKIFHFIMIWLVPFVWILILKSLMNSAPGSHEVKNKEVAKAFSDNDNDALNTSNMGF